MRESSVTASPQPPGGSNSYAACSPLPAPGREIQIENLHSTAIGAFCTEALAEIALQFISEVTSARLMFSVAVLHTEEG